MFMGSGPNKGLSPVEWREILFVHPFVRLFPLWLALRPCWQALRPCWLALRPYWLALRPLQVALRPLLMDKWMVIQMDVWNFS